MTPSESTTPATLTATIVPTTPPGQTAMVTIRGPGNSLILPVSTYVTLPPDLLFGRLSVTFAAKAGPSAVMTKSLNAAERFEPTVTTDTGATG